MRVNWIFKKAEIRVRNVCRVTGKVFRCQQDADIFKKMFNRFWVENHKTTVKQYFGLFTLYTAQQLKKS